MCKMIYCFCDTNILHLVPVIIFHADITSIYTSCSQQFCSHKSYHKSYHHHYHFNEFDHDTEKCLVVMYFIAFLGHIICHKIKNKVLHKISFCHRTTMNLPQKTHCDFLHVINQSFPIVITLVKRCIQFLYYNFYSKNVLVQSVFLFDA